MLCNYQVYPRIHINKFKSTSSYTTCNFLFSNNMKKKKPHNYACNSNFTIFFDLEEVIFEIFNIFENNIISVELANILGYICKLKTFFHHTH
jgi:hypothetical protein